MAGEMRLLIGFLSIAALFGADRKTGAAPVSPSDVARMQVIERRVVGLAFQYQAAYRDGAAVRLAWVKGQLDGLIQQYVALYGAVREASCAAGGIAPGDCGFIRETKGGAREVLRNPKPFRPTEANQTKK